MSEVVKWTFANVGKHMLSPTERWIVTYLSTSRWHFDGRSASTMEGSWLGNLLTIFSRRDLLWWMEKIHFTIAKVSIRLYQGLLKRTVVSYRDRHVPYHHGWEVCFNGDTRKTHKIQLLGAYVGDMCPNMHYTMCLQKTTSIIQRESTWVYV